ncbi:MAG: hypothetical protein HN542_11500 [Flavobacteriales bacterium]|jgi:hypothetical protein|nr:hypothetical protein [Flavobacteriales bacterium]NCG29328.1 hypothetical protein [Bacteroidota bacterium]MBT3964740.1 hypothetical protein [Flavobacteriales bacterium]MBT4704715.1 hypothetical protein [Flavobacteriales bacterium]MBT4931702.1 hypothetical protein [Flavobacteriales bacterium]
MKFPAYRKYTNRRSLFKITSYQRFQEIKLTGSKSEFFYFEAKVHPDRILIQDMLDMKDDHWEISSAEEFDLERKKTEE